MIRDIIQLILGAYLVVGVCLIDTASNVFRFWFKVFPALLAVLLLSDLISRYALAVQ